MLETEEERSARLVKNALMVVVGISMISALMILDMVWEHYKPLPKEDACSNIGYQGGVKIDNGVICYNRCEGNTFDTCRQMRVVMEAAA